MQPHRFAWNYHNHDRLVALANSVIASIEYLLQNDRRQVIVTQISENKREYIFPLLLSAISSTWQLKENQVSLMTVISLGWLDRSFVTSFREVPQRTSIFAKAQNLKKYLLTLFIFYPCSATLRVPWEFLWFLLSKSRESALPCLFWLPHMQGAI